MLFIYCLFYLVIQKQKTLIHKETFILLVNSSLHHYEAQLDVAWNSQMYLQGLYLTGLKYKKFCLLYYKGLFISILEFWNFQNIGNLNDQYSPVEDL